MSLRLQAPCHPRGAGKWHYHDDGLRIVCKAMDEVAKQLLPRRPLCAGGEVMGWGERIERLLFAFIVAYGALIAWRYLT